MKNSFLLLYTFYFSVSAFCQRGEQKIKLDKKGQILFDQHCSSCHSFVQNGIGPHLGGISKVVSKEWLLAFIQNPQAQIDKGDKRAAKLVEQYTTVMPSFSHLPAKELNSIITYISEQASPKSSVLRDYGIPVKDPIPEKIQMSDLVLNIEPYIQVPASDDKEPLTRISLMNFHPVTKDNYIADLRGKLYRIKDSRAEVYLDISKIFPNFIDQPSLATGFGAFAFHPDFENNGLLYTTHTEAPGSAKADFDYADSINVTLQWVVSEWKTNEPMDFPLKASPRELFRINMVSGMHGIQEIGFNPLAKSSDEDYGNLYIAIGDGAAVQMGSPFIPHNKKNIWGCLLRIDPQGKNSENGKYGYPESNPYAGTENRGEIYAMGFRNPHRFTWTSTGKLLVNNIGQNSVETINLVKPGSDFGWPMREGRLRLNEMGDLNLAYEIPANERLDDFNLPAIEIDHDELGAIGTILEYTGTKVPALQSKLFFTSISVARLFYVEEKEVLEGSRAEVKEFRVAMNGKIVTFNELTGNSWRADLRMGRDAYGELYFFTKRDGMIYKVVSVR